MQIHVNRSMDGEGPCDLQGRTAAPGLVSVVMVVMMVMMVISSGKRRSRKRHQQQYNSKKLLHREHPSTRFVSGSRRLTPPVPQVQQKWEAGAADTEIECFNE